jgi:DNA-binding CsgD family transcriptional regulator
LPSTLVVATCRQDELTVRLPAGEMLERLERRHFVHHVHLERLGRAEVGAFLASVHGAVPPSGLVDTLHGRTGGNPFFLEEILNVAGDVDPADLDRQPLPWSLAELVRGQLDGLSAEERRLVQAAAVLARRAEFDLLAEVTGTNEDELIRVLRGLLDRGLLMEECEDSFTFRHALVRDAVEHQLLGRERRRLHEAALEAMRRSPCEDLAALAHHARGAGRYDEFVALARQGAASYLAGGSSHQALRLAADALGEEPGDIELRAIAARAAWLLGLYEEALVHAQQWRRVVSAGLPGDRAAAARMLARVFHEMDRVDDMWSAVAELEQLVAELPPGEDRALTMAWLAQLLMVRMRSHDAVSWAERAIAEADAVGARGVRAQALVERASAIGELPGRYVEAGEALREAVVEAEAVGDWVLVARAVNNLTTYVPLGSPEGRVLIGRLREVNERAGFDGAGAYYRFRTAEFTIFDGDLLEARRLLDAMPPVGGAHMRASYQVLDGLVAVEEGRIDAAAKAVEIARPDNRPYDQAMFLSLALVVASHQADRSEVARCLDAVLVHTPHQGFHIDPGGIIDRLEALERAGLAAQASATVAIWRERVLPGPFVTVADGLVAAMEGRHDDALASLADALASPELHLAAYQRARVRVVLARSLAALGRRDEAVAAARHARQDLARWPGWRRDEVDALVQRLGGGPPAPAAGEGELTAREREVATLLAEGLTNAELARRLYISPKTAAVHVSNILMKLGMGSRAEVAAWAVRTGLAAGAKGDARGS